MEVVIDANIFFRTLISAGNILEIFFNNNLILYAPYKLKEEFIKNKKEILEKSQLTEQEFSELQFLLFDKINFVKFDEYKEFLLKAEKLLDRHFKDEDFIALCILKNCKFWTYENRIFEIGFGISTKEINEELLADK